MYSGILLTSEFGCGTIALDGRETLKNGDNCIYNESEDL